MRMTIRAAFCGLVLLIATLAGCGAEKVGFKTTDVTGATYAREFELTDHTGARRTLADFRGKVTAVFFGFTRCPDVCPSTLAQMKLVLASLEADAKRVQVLFITVDPERDTSEALAQYVTAFDPSFIGLTGSVDDIKRVAKEFKVFFQKAPGTSADNYSVDHTAAYYVFDPSGRVRLFMRHNTPPADFAADIKLLLAGK
ncbi:MAG: SCO family protein [Burkholderiales bacterium]